MEEAVEADQVMVMEDGRLSLTGTPRQIFENVEQIRRAGLDIPKITALAYNLKKRSKNRQTTLKFRRND